MKPILLLIGAAILLATAGCDWDHDQHHGGYGGAYDGGGYGYGHGEYHGYPDYDGHWERR